MGGHGQGLGQVSLAEHLESGGLERRQPDFDDLVEIDFGTSLEAVQILDIDDRVASREVLVVETTPA